MVDRASVMAEERRGTAASGVASAMRAAETGDAERGAEAERREEKRQKEEQKRQQREEEEKEQKQSGAEEPSWWRSS